MLQVGEVSHKLGLNPQTLYFYERIGLIPKPKRTESGYRLYEQQDLERLAFITRAKALGLTLDEIKEVLLLQNGEAPTCREIHSKLVIKVSQIEEVIAHLQELKSELLPLIQHCEKTLLKKENLQTVLFFRTNCYEAKSCVLGECIRNSHSCSMLLYTCSRYNPKCNWLRGCDWLPRLHFTACPSCDADHHICFISSV